MVVCEKCENQLEQDSKYCTNCGEKISDSSLQNLHQSKTSIKIKNFVLKSIAFILALFITLIVKLMLVVAGLIDASDFSMKTGIFLFLGLWFLLTGLFLKNNDKRNWGYGLLVFYVIGSIGLGYVINNSSTGLDARIHATMKKTPIKLNDEIELSSIAVQNNDVHMVYTFLNVSKSQFTDSGINDFESLTEDFDTCEDEGYIDMMKYGKNITISFYGNEGDLVAEKVLSASSCGSVEG